MPNLDLFDYNLPESCIAQEPVKPRDHSRLMLINRKTHEISHHHVYDLPNLLPSRYSIVANNTKVFPARLIGHKKTGGKVEVLLTTSLGKSTYHCITKPGLTKGDLVIFPDGLEAQVEAANPSHEIERTIVFNKPEQILRTDLSRIGQMPTPPYIKQLLRNQKDYQTIYAKYGFSAAAPTAGLHFTQSLLKRIKADHSWYEITLDVGLGTFLPVKTNDITKHHMHSEYFRITNSVAKDLNAAKQNKVPVLSIGTTTLRALESSVNNHSLQAAAKQTDIFIYPPYQFQYVDALMTNFHLPKSTLLMLVSAFTTEPNSTDSFTSFQNSLLGHAYQIAIAENYRFFSFGDAMLII